MHLEGIHIFPGLPNSTSATQEMYDVYQMFKGDCDTKAQEMFATTTKTYKKALIIEQKKVNKDDDSIVG